MNKALVIGIDTYQNPANNLSGCVSDALSIAHILKDIYTFKNDQIRLLCNERATQIEILSRLQWLVDQSQPGDILVYYQASHGSQIRDRNNDELLDQMDEILVPYDMNWSTPLTDDMIQQYLQRVHKEATIICIFDTCHSGTMTRHLFKKPVVRYLPPPVDIQFRSEGREKMRVLRHHEGRENQLLLAACQESESAQEIRINRKSRGIFTYALEQVMTRYRRNISYQGLIDEVQRFVTKKVGEQHPVLECSELYQAQYIF